MLEEGDLPWRTRKRLFQATYIQTHTYQVIPKISSTICETSVTFGNFSFLIHYFSDTLFSLIIFIYVTVTFLYIFYAFCWREEVDGEKPKVREEEEEEEEA